MSGNPWERAHSLTLTTRCCSGWRTRPCKHNYQYNCNRVQLYQLVLLQFISWLICIWHVGNTCLPMGSGLVTVVLKNPSHSRRPYRPAQWLWRLPVWGRHQGISVLNCLSAGSHGFPSAERQQVRISIIWKTEYKFPSCIELRTNPQHRNTLLSGHRCHCAHSFCRSGCSEAFLWWCHHATAPPYWADASSQSQEPEEFGAYGPPPGRSCPTTQNQLFKTATLV